MREGPVLLLSSKIYQFFVYYFVYCRQHCGYLIYLGLVYYILVCNALKKNINYNLTLQVTFEVTESSFLGAKVNTAVGYNEAHFSTGGLIRNIFGRGEELSCEYTHGTKKSTSFYTTFVKPFHNEADSV